MESEYNWNQAVKYITRSATNEERIHFEKWLSGSPENREWFEKIKSAWEISGSKFKDFNPNAAEDWPLVKRMTIDKQATVFRKSGEPFRTIIKIAAVFIIAAGLGFLTWGIVKNADTFQSEKLTYATGNSVRQFTLPDSSKVWLNKHSELTLSHRFLKQKRKVSLTGEAFFEVTKDTNKPFIVITNEITTRVVGTSFNLRSTAEGVQLSVATGKVAFYKSGNRRRQLFLIAGKVCHYQASDNNFSKISEVHPNYLAWKTGIIRFENTSLSQVCNQLEQIFETPIHISDSSIKEYPITGTFEQVELDELLDIISITLDIQVERQDQSIVLSR